MEFRPCIDIHNGKVKQIVGGTLRDEGDAANENYVSEKDAVFYANLYKKYHLKGGHIILLNSSVSDFFEATKMQAIKALRAYPGGLQIGGGITADNAIEYIREGASHVIVTSYVFKDGNIKYENLDKLIAKVGKEKIVIDLSCRKKDGRYYIVTDRWQKYTEVELSYRTLDEFSDYCDEFLIHAVDVEGKANGIEEELAEMLGNWNKIPITYAGGVHDFKDLEKLKAFGKDKINVTIGSALDLFGGNMKWEEVTAYIANKKEPI
ncbi:MAG: phosphoribosylformimino-5-aminoimidazole carboxamide ribotide isomerase [Clostridiales bacterium]|nr:phosphoribosylformimino-5-aminoimidazole carboxamide ribotide isomerase [Clostridiales bacterium]